MRIRAVNTQPGQRMDVRGSRSDRTSVRAARSRLGIALAVLSAGAGIVHLSVVAEHMREDARFGAFFVVLAVFQLGWAAVVVARPTRSALRVGAAVNGAVLVVWAVSRTVGIPFGPHAGVPEAIGMTDLVSTGLEAAIVAGSLAMTATTRIYAATARAFVALAIASVPFTALAWTASGHDGTAEAETSTPHDDAESDHRHGPGDPHGDAEPEPHPILHGED